MKWYKWNDELINLSMCQGIRKQVSDSIIFSFEDDLYKAYFENKEKRDEEFEKICRILGFDNRDYTSHCC